MFRHPAKVCMTYFEHFKFSFEMSRYLAIGTYKAIIHAIYPDAYITSTSDTVQLIKKRLDESGCNDSPKKAFSYGDYVVNNKNVSKKDKQKAIK